VPCTTATIATGDKVTFGIRPEHLMEDDLGDAQIHGEVMVVEHLGGETYLYVKLPGGQVLMIKAGGESRTRIGDRITIGVPSAHSFLFDHTGLSLERTTRHELVGAATA
jgi:multiple sugar transport system ATP-binding protein